MAVATVPDALALASSGHTKRDASPMVLKAVIRFPFFFFLGFLFVSFLFSRSPNSNGFLSWALPLVWTLDWI